MRLILSVVSRLKTASPQRVQTVAGIRSTRTGWPSIWKTSLTNSSCASVELQTWHWMPSMFLLERSSPYFFARLREAVAACGFALGAALRLGGAFLEGVAFFS